MRAVNRSSCPAASSSSRARASASRSGLAVFAGKPHAAVASAAQTAGGVIHRTMESLPFNRNLSGGDRSDNRRPAPAPLLPTGVSRLADADEGSQYVLAELAELIPI
jgi:hypothetical protein